MVKQYEFIQYRDTMKIPDGIYNALYNKEPCTIRMENNIPVWVTFIGFKHYPNGEEEIKSGSSIFDSKGVMHSNVELLLPAQTF